MYRYIYIYIYIFIYIRTHIHTHTNSLSLSHSHSLTLSHTHESRLLRKQYVPKTNSSNSALMVALLLHHTPSDTGASVLQNIVSFIGLFCKRDMFLGSLLSHYQTLVLLFWMFFETGRKEYEIGHHSPEQTISHYTPEQAISHCTPEQAISHTFHI